MNCRTSERMINEMIDQGLSVEQAEKLKEHIASCPKCQKLLDDLTALVNRARSFEKVLPTADLWPAIQRGITNEGHKRAGSSLVAWLGVMLRVSFPSKQFVVVAAVLLLTFGMVIWSTLRWNSGQSKGVTNGLEQPVEDHFAHAQYHYTKAIEALNAAIESRRETLDPQMSHVFEQNLAVIDNSIQTCRDALRQQPESPEAKKYLLLCYRKKVELLHEYQSFSRQTG